MTGGRILLVEDNAMNRRLVQFLLTSQGHIVYEATNGQEGSTWPKPMYRISS